MSIKVIGLTGKKLSGKSTLAKAIITEAALVGRIGCIYSFAKPLKEICHILFGGTEGNWYGDFKNQKMAEWSLALGNKYATPRRILQTIGTEVFREQVADDFWLFVAHRYITDIVATEHCELIVIDDVRFDNEAQFIVSMFDGVICQIQRAATVAEDDAHRSESGISRSLVDFSYVCDSVDSVKECAADIVRREHV